MSRRSRSRSRSPPKRDREDRRRRDDRDREKKRDRKDKDRERRRRHRSSSSETSIAESHQLGSIFREERRRRERNDSPKLPPPPPPPPSDSPVDTSIPFDVNTLNDPTKRWLEEKIVEQVTARVHQLEAMMAEKATSARNEMEKMLRAQIEAEMAVELAECKKRDVRFWIAPVSVSQRNSENFNWNKYFRSFLNYSMSKAHAKNFRAGFEKNYV
ncbi:hypothetical protein L5515_004895 [Caenorhabditis briggsae]|uniref:Uncharacterized protein n=1 Tax=Caenorhabditis briggsae TaxID=6238 RepID=A0AAE9EMR1_CAEBR|nr:hypothetical protein L5515_004895 [Caenorhabditis briggsae]